MEMAARRPNPLGWRYLRRISLSLVVADACGSHSSSLLDLLASTSQRDRAGSSAAC